jgi:hypothetical protein
VWWRRSEAAGGGEERPGRAGGARFQEGLPQDHFPAILRPRFVPAGRARIAPDAPVFGVAADGEAHAYALRLLDGHEIVNDTVGRHRIVATW